MKKHVLACTAAMAICLAAPAALAQEAAAPQGADTAADDIIVTGSTRAERRFDVSYAINSVSQEEIQRIAPLNTADLIGQLPGFQTESTGGEVQNIYRIRGLPNDGGFVSFQQDGLPLFHENDGFFFRGDALIRPDLMTERLEVVRGGPAPVYASYSGAIVNAVTVTGRDESRGKARVTLGDTGLYRLDAVQSGKLDDSTHYAIGGFLRYHDGYRDNGFPNDRGGQIRANLTHDTGTGTLKVSTNYVNDHNVFYLPIPTADPRDPSRSLDRYIDYFSGTMNSPALRDVNLKYRDGAGVIQGRSSDLSTGRHMQMFNAGVQYDTDLGDWLISAKAGFTKGRLDFTAFYSTTNPSDGATFANSYLAASRTAFGPVASMGYVLAGSSTVYDPYAASGLVVQGQYRDIHSRFYSAQGDFSVARAFDTAIGRHDLKVGVYASAYGASAESIYQNYLIEVAGKPRTLDLVAYSATGAVLGRVTDSGALNYAATLTKGDADAKMVAVYANDTWEVVRGLRVDAGIRHERYDYAGYAANTAQYNLGDPTTLADNTTRGFTGTITNRTLKPNITNWTAGVNYDFTRHFGIYARASHLETPPSMQVTYTINPTIITTKADQYEVGVKLQSGGSYLYATGFYTNFDPLNASFLAFDPTTGRNDVNVPFIGEAQIKGVELDGLLKATDWFQLNAALTVSSPEYRNFRSSTGADPQAAEGKQIVREPKVYGNLRPTFRFAAGDTDVDLYGRWNYMGKRYVDIYNNTALPSYSTFGAGVTATRGDWQVQVVGDNLTNAKGLTEGNTRTDNLSGQGTANAIYGRPIFGRNVRLVVTRSW